ncbi:MAG: phosphatidate cytidylyltransferase [Halobacteriovoraceae bacterium]|nr:phosphatidate cytidylyltransferase [Halobacteriovoraceae bacterium]
MKSNTQLRIISALVLVSILGVCIYLGSGATLGLILTIGMITLDEFYTNFLAKQRFSKSYFFGQLILIVSFIYVNFFGAEDIYKQYIINFAIFLNLLLIIYLFASDIEKTFIEDLVRKFPIAPSIYVSSSFIALSTIFHFDVWRKLTLILFMINFGMDTGAWFFGKNFGNKKLWPEVSPNKTIEGLIGGMLTSGLTAFIVTFLTFNRSNIQLFVTYCIFGLLSQIGDLIQSKIKRQFSIKDSSSLIPGHGGVYDRIDSLLFVAPFFALFTYGFILSVKP